jgi:hypothetical protein
MTLLWNPIDNDGAAAGPSFMIATGPTRGPGSRVVLESTIAHQRLVETVAYPRAAEADQFDRGNRATVFNALVAYEFLTFKDCAQFCADLGRLVSGRGNLTITYIGGGTNVLRRAVWQNISTPVKLGTSVAIPFSFIGAPMTT